MQQQELVSDFSELKDLLIRTYGIDRNRELVRLFFSIEGNELLMHDYDDHKKEIILCIDLKMKKLRDGLTEKAHNLVVLSLNYTSPEAFLITEFKLNGFFRS